MEYNCFYQSPVGQLELVSDGQYLTQLLFSNQQQPTERVNKASLPIFKQTRSWLDTYFKGERPQETIPVQPSGTTFQQYVWEELNQIEYGKLTTYGDIAQCIAQKMNKDKMSAQAVGGAVGSNPISIIIPCHRVVGKNGSLTGYGGRLPNKIKLLEIENIDMTHLFTPKHTTKP
ncbi:methylated-DNA--[protein]-cysteine S-methyltransferase [Staphylococcus warneri]|uniref:Methylated-DNA--protein-cysteine methyltransferase n=1 Tax=Staphylococcus warneri TaxID=1292 RepID=A0A2T4Q3Z8_STAWA|nr:methylated-DNA--[protein]-cysteine S-methyltransferase [Staphylococcus warneri]PTI14835.1 methylated-DNA--[protein]-cysteine S-methyltransferase [Staphylococcus warneri]PTI16942.1 methylated-DNA--[protein]-cysteine S-methyltransferase [Staphylococcus warneri]PTI26239.1 methylated-DNA--[protein]-cysteine S-methyltransferase [Staphylococcus warneri]PTI35915.1 methylated-DNA--[protein]-cysteine S-methyltransferase [Staphylococcus warneri]PTI52707.1 methylated-DNA--[protein]-cysteine S-methyltr